MDECLLPSEIARLVFGYLEDEGCTEASKKFLETSENLKECRSRSSQGVRFRTRVLGFNLVEMLQLVASVYSLVEERTRRTPVPKEIAHGSFLEQLNYLLNVSDQSGGGELPNGVTENNTGLLKALNRTMFENTTFHKKLAENINKMRTTPDGLAPETIAESIVKEKGFQELIDELLDAVPVTEVNQTGGKSSKENRPARVGSNIHHNKKDDGKKKTPENSFEAGKTVSNGNQISLDDENAAAVQSILESCRMPSSWKGGSDQADCVSKVGAGGKTASTNRKAADTASRQPSSILDKAMIDCVTPLKEIAFNTYNNSCALELNAEQADSDRAPDTESGGGSVNGDVCLGGSTKTCGPDHSGADSPAAGAGLLSPAELLNCTPVLLVCNSPNSQNVKVLPGVTSYNLHTRAEDRRIKSKFRRILPKPTNTSTTELNGRISFPNGITLQVLNQSKEMLSVTHKKDSEGENVNVSAEDRTKVDNTQVENQIDESVTGDVNENLVVEKMGLPDIQTPIDGPECSDNLGEKDHGSDLCSKESLGNCQDQSIDESNLKDKITPVDRQGPRKKLSLSTPRRGRHIRSLDFTTPNKKILGQRSKTSPKQILHQQRFRQSKLRSNLFKSPPNKLQTIPDVVEKDDEQIEKSLEETNGNNNQEVSSNVAVERNVSEVLKADDVENNCAPGKSEKSKVGESTWDSNLRALVGENSNICTMKRQRKRQTRKAWEMNKRSSALKKIEEINDVNTSNELKDRISPSKDASCAQNTSESKMAESSKDEGSDVTPKTSGIELNTSPQLIFQTPLKFDQPFVPQTPVLDTPLLKSIIDDTKTIDPDLLLTPSFQMTPFKPRSEKKVTVQTLSPSKMLTNKSCEKVKIESAKKSPTSKSSASINAKSNSGNNTVKTVSPKSNVPTTRQRNNDQISASKTSSKKNGTCGKSDLIQSLMKQAEKNILGSLSDMESEDDEEPERKPRSSVRCSKKSNKKQKLDNSDFKANESVNKSVTTDSSSYKDGASVSEKSIEITEKSSPAKRKSPSKKDKEIQNSACVEKDQISPIKDSDPSNTHNKSVKEDVSENVEALSKSKNSPSIIINNLSNENQEKTSSPKIVTDNTSGSCSSFPPKKKYVQTILLSTSTSIQSKKLLKVKSSTANSSMVETSTAKSSIAIASPPKPNKSVFDKSSDESPTKRSSFTDQQTIDFLLEKKKRLLNKLREPPIKPKKKKNCAEDSTASSPTTQKRVGSLNRTKSISKNKSQIRNTGRKSSLTASKCTNESLQNLTDDSSLSPFKTSTPYVKKITKNLKNTKKNVENEFSPSKRLGKTFSEITTKKNLCNTSNNNASIDREVHSISVPDENQFPVSRKPVSEPRSPPPLDKCEAGKRILVGNELYEHVFHDENRPIKKSGPTIVDDKDLSISIVDFNMDGEEFETVFVAQPLNTLFEFIPFESSCRSEKPETQLNRNVCSDDGVKKDSPKIGSDVKIVSKPPVVNGTGSPPTIRTSRLVQMASNRTSNQESSNKDDKTRRGDDRYYRNFDSSRKRHPVERSRDRYSSSCSPPRRPPSRGRYKSEGGTETKSDKRTGSRNRNRSRDRSRERRRSKSYHRDKSRGRNREESKRSSRSKDRSRSKGASERVDKASRKESRRGSRKYRDSSRTKHVDSERHNERPKRNNQMSASREEYESSEDGEVRSKDDESSDECQSTTVAASHHNQTSSRALNDASAARIPSRAQLGKRPSNDDGKIIAEKRPKTDDAQKLLKNMDSEHLEKFLSVVHPED